MKQILKKAAQLVIIGILFLAGCNPKTQTPTPIVETTVTEVMTTALPVKLTIREELNIPKGNLISEIQGAGHRSPFVSMTVTNVFGIVTAKRGDGFYMQDPEGDGDPATSEGIAVVIRGFPRMVPGDAILIKSGVVKEFNPAGEGSNSLTITQIQTNEFEVLGTGYPVPEATVIGIGGRVPPSNVIDDDVRGNIATSGSFDIDTDGIDFYESLESMLVQVNNAVAISATTGFKEIALLSDMGENASVRTSRGGILLRENDFNPERIIIDDSLRSIPKVEMGDTFTKPVIGILDYTFGNFKLQITQPLEVIPGNLEPEKSKLFAGSNQISIATYNVENLDALDDPSRLVLLADHIVNSLNSPDIIGLQEIMDNDGEIDSLDLSADQSFQNIIDAVLDIGGPQYEFTNIDPRRNLDGGAPGGNIRVGFIYRTDRGLTLVAGTPGDAKTPVEIIDNGGSPQFSLNPGRVEPQNSKFFDSRKPLAAQFLFNGQNIFVIVCHLNSKGGDDPLYGSFLPPFESSAIQRAGQARVINAFVQELLAVDPKAKVIVLGDMNDFPWSDSIQALQKDALTNLVTTLPLEEQYTYIYDGNSQVLDQIFASSGMMDSLIGVDVVHVNAEYYYQERLSDHDPVLALFDLN
jgi:predicted extracellular nuclease